MGCIFVTKKKGTAWHTITAPEHRDVLRSGNVIFFDANDIDVNTRLQRLRREVGQKAPTTGAGTEKTKEEKKKEDKEATGVAMDVGGRARGTTPVVMCASCGRNPASVECPVCHNILYCCATCCIKDEPRHDKECKPSR